MSRIEFSSDLLAQIPGRILNKNASTISSSEAPSGVGLINSPLSNISECVFLEIFSGVKLTRAQLDASRSLATASNPYPLARTNNRLLAFTNGITSSQSGDFSPSVVANPATIATVYKTATRTGQASWFCLAHGIAASNVGPLTFGNYIVGDVGPIGSGSDLEIEDVNIVSGELYRVTGFKLKFPAYWDY